MDNFKLKIILSVLAGVLFSFILVLIAFATPITDKQDSLIVLPKNKLEEVSQSVKNR